MLEGQTAHTIATIPHIRPLISKTYFLHQIEEVTKNNYKKEETENEL